MTEKRNHRVTIRCSVSGDALDIFDMTATEWERFIARKLIDPMAALRDLREHRVVAEAMAQKRAAPA